MDLTDDFSPVGDRQDEQAVIICLRFPIGKFENKKALDAVFDLGEIIREVIETSGKGTYKGHTFDEGEDNESVTFFISGKDARVLYREIKPILQSLPSLPNSSIIKRYSSFPELL